MGAAFGLVVSGLVESFINPLIAWLVGKPNFDSLVFTLPPIFGDEPTVFEYGKILTAIVNFFLVSLAIYFFIIIPMNKLTASLKKEEAETPPAQPSEEILLLREIRDSLAIRRAVANKAALEKKGE